MKKLKGIYKNEKTNNLFYVNEVIGDKVNVSPVTTIGDNAIGRVLDSTLTLPRTLVETFYHCGAYTKETIND